MVAIARNLQFGIPIAKTLLVVTRRDDLPLVL